MLQIYYHTANWVSPTYTPATFGRLCVEQKSVGHRDKETGMTHRSYYHPLHKITTFGPSNSQSADSYF